MRVLLLLTDRAPLRVEVRGCLDGCSPAVQAEVISVYVTNTHTLSTALPATTVLCNVLRYNETHLKVGRLPALHIQLDSHTHRCLGWILNFNVRMFVCKKTVMVYWLALNDASNHLQ